MRDRGSYQPEGASANASDYGVAFVRQAHALLAVGYAALVPPDYSGAEEEHITGSLVQAIDAALDDPNAPLWMRWFSVHEEPRLHDTHRKGKRRRRLDIRIDCLEARPRKRLPFEAKRLGPDHGVSLYLGQGGLGRFVNGRYAPRESLAGMLGYVQAGSPEDWADRIDKAMARRAAELHTLESSPWRKEWLVDELPHTYRSGHDRPSVGQAVEVYHTLLTFN